MNALVFTAVFGVVLLFAGLFVANKASIKYLAIAGTVAAFAVNALEWGQYSAAPVSFFNGMLRVNQFSILFNTVAIGSTLLYLLLSGREFEKVGEHVAEYFALIFFILSGVMVASAYGNLLMLFLAIEIISIPQYILAGSDKKNLKSNEASLKYFLMGAFSTGFLLLGIALVYGGTGTFNISEMQLAGSEDIHPFVLIGMVLILMALSFKVSAAPFHFWTPDVYDGAPTVFTSYMATVVKAAGFIAFIRLFNISFGAGNISHHWILILGIITGATLVIGNLTAVFQQSVKRMLAYSSIAQAGFMLFAVIALNQTAMQGIVLYALAYCVATIGIFAILLKMKDYTFEGFNGLAKTQPLLAFVNTVFLFSLAGIPLTAGFFAKYFVLAAAIEQGQLLWLVILAVLCAAVSVYYYFRVVVAMYFREGAAETAVITPAFKALLLIAAIVIILLGLFPGLLLSWL